MNYQNLQIQELENITHVIVSRPQALNALNRDVLSELKCAFTEDEKLKKARVVVISGAGDKAFVAGADIASMKGLTQEQARDFCLLGHAVMNAIQNFKAPVICAVNGFALGGGLELALACDFIYASPKAKLGLPEVNLGLFPGFGGTQRLLERIGSARAKELIFIAKILNAQEAYDWGIVNIITQDDVVAHAIESAKLIATKAPVAISLAKQAINEGIGCELKNGLEIEATLFPTVFSTQDCQEGIEAFLTKRQPQFNGN